MTAAKMAERVAGPVVANFEPLEGGLASRAYVYGCKCASVKLQRLAGIRSLRGLRGIQRGCWSGGLTGT